LCWYEEVLYIFANTTLSYTYTGRDEKTLTNAVRIESTARVEVIFKRKVFYTLETRTAEK
jgi:hypothetical protein